LARGVRVGAALGRAVGAGVAAALGVALADDAGELVGKGGEARLVIDRALLMTGDAPVILRARLDAIEEGQTLGRVTARLPRLAAALVLAPRALLHLRRAARAHLTEHGG